TAETQPEATAETQPEAIVETQPEAIVETQPEATAETQPEAIVETQPEATVETQPEATAETQPEATVETQPEATAETQPEATVKTQPEATAEPQIKTAAKTPSEVAAVREQEPAAEAPQAVVEQASSTEPAKKKPAGPKKIETFHDLPLNFEIQQAIESSGYVTPTDVQAEIIPHMVAGRDVLAQSQTGTGKTAAFALPILCKLSKKSRKPQVLVLAPTRELAMQVSKSFSTYGANLPNFSIATIYGGQDYEPQLRQLRRGVQVVVGTPGRVIDHINRGTLDVSGLKCLVLDEADEMLNMGFLEDVKFVLEKTPDERQIALFSATLPGPIRGIAERYLNDPIQITIKRKTMTAESIRQRAIFVSPRDKIDVLTRILEAEETDGVIVFTKTKIATLSVAENLTRNGLSAVALNGDMPQKTRERTIEQFKAGHLNVLVATDVAARGLDVSRVSHVFNFDLPHDSESYIHRVGRTGRAGRSGEAIIFLTNAQRGKLRMIERATKQPIEVVEKPTANNINEMRVQRFKEQITKVTASSDLTMFKELISEYAEETGKPMEIIAAALAEIGQQGRSFLMKDRPARKRSDRDEPREKNRRDRFQSDNNFDRPRRSREIGPPEDGMERFRLQVGHRDGVKPGNIVGAIANEAGIDGEFIGPIKILDGYSTVDLPEGMPQDIFESLQTVRISGKLMRIAKDHGSSDRDSKSDGPKRRFGKGGPGKGGPGKRKDTRPPHAHGGKRHSGKPKKRSK
ncbi:MAG: DEAD/DEAH box helicase, partial [Rubripirellula sp.]